MKKNGKSLLAMALAGLIGFGLAGCASQDSVNIADNGQSADEIVFPDVADATLQDGSFPNVANVRLIKPGMSKDQLYNLIGTPDDWEGALGVREWDYLFHFRVGDDQVKTCQFKVLFDTDYVAQSYYWNPADCAALINPPAVSQTFTLAGDALFAFDRSDVSGITQKGVESLDRIAGKLRDNIDSIERVDVAGYTDRLGSAAYNRQLSAKRAQSIRRFLVARGIPAGKVFAEGRGEADPVVQCDQGDHDALIACLAPNRRVVITATGKQTVKATDNG